MTFSDNSEQRQDDDELLDAYAGEKIGIVLGALVVAAISILLFCVVEAMNIWDWEQDEQEVVTLRCSNPTGLQAMEMRVRRDYTTLSHDGFLYRNNRTGTTIVYNSAPGEMCVLHPIEGTATLEE